MVFYDSVDNVCVQLSYQKLLITKVLGINQLNLKFVKFTHKIKTQISTRIIYSRKKISCYTKIN